MAGDPLPLLLGRETGEDVVDPGPAET